MSVTYLMRHAPTEYSTRYLLNGDRSIEVPLTSAAAADCVAVRGVVAVGELASCVASPFARCVRTAELLVDGAVMVGQEARLGELDYGCFDGRPFLAYARWLATNGPDRRPDGGQESQREGISRMVAGLASILKRPGPRLVVAHGLLVSVVGWAIDHPAERLLDVFLPVAPYLVPLVIGDRELTGVLGSLGGDKPREGSWRVDPRVFPAELWPQLGTVPRFGGSEREPVASSEVVTDA